MTMMKAVNKLQIQKGKADEVIALFEKPKSVHTFEGFIMMEVLKKEHTDEYDELFISTTWKDHSCFEAWREHRATEKAHAGKTDKKHSPIVGSELSLFEIALQHHPVI